jgi:hypothetical protein
MERPETKEESFKGMGVWKTERKGTFFETKRDDVEQNRNVETKRGDLKRGHDLN